MVKTIEEIFNNAAQRNMGDWNLSEFKKTHPHLYKSIIEALGEIQNVNINVLRDKIRIDIGDVAIYKDVANSIYKESSSASDYAKKAFMRGAECALNKLGDSLKS